MKRFKRGCSPFPVVIKSGELAVIPGGDEPRIVLGPPFVSAVVSNEHRTALTPPAAK